VSDPAAEPATTPTRTGPSRTWFVIAFVPFLLSLIPAYFLGQAAADEVDVRLDVLTDRTVDIEDDDRSIFTRNERIIEQSPRCVLRSVTGQATPLDGSGESLSTDQDGATWYRIARLPDDVEPNTYALRCRAGGDDVEPTTLAVSSTPRWGQFALLLLAAFGLPVAAAILGTLLVVAIVVMRRRAEHGERSLSAIQLE
jgi:hypothetical protein